MLDKIFNIKKKESNTADESVLIAALLVHAAKIDENYTANEKKIIKKALMNIKSIDMQEAEKVLTKAEEKEQKSNQIIGYTKEIKKNSMKFRLKIIEILWKIVYSDGSSDNYESNLIRRVCGLLYVSDKDSGMIKLKVKNLFKKI